MIFKKSVDPRIKKLLDSMGLTYEVKKDGLFNITFALENERIQMVSISSKTEMFNDLEIRDIHSIAAAIPDDEFTMDIASVLLTENYKTKFGAWSIDKSDGMTIIIYSAKIAADIDDDSINSVLEMVIKQADSMEVVIHGDDNF